MADFAALQALLSPGFSSLSAFSETSMLMIVDPIAFFMTVDPFLAALWVSLFWGSLCWLASLITNNHSWVDKLWSLVPFFYAWQFAITFVLKTQASLLNQPRFLLMCVLPTVWGLRLTYNFARKGGYALDGEDYRWEVVRKAIPRVLFELLNFTFIAYFQHILLFFIATPAYLAYLEAVKTPEGLPLRPLDFVAAGFFVCFLVLESVADQQQWVFHHYKKAYNDTLLLAPSQRAVIPLLYQRDVKRGFLSTGLFKYSRHPNFFSEQSIWWSYYLFAVSASGLWCNWTLLGCGTLSLLFQASTHLTEQISASKYPLYNEYKRMTSRFLPLPPTGSLDEAEDKDD
eukprot:GILI01008447.1.p1 GENE.GILI01008447.1~~GILI01008447.1.p1  ORF type:complete len:343 (+),score=116.13 GILI01008447.1:135-1163(+)